MKSTFRRMFATAAAAGVVSTIGIVAGATPASAANFDNVISCVSWRGADGSYNMVCQHGTANIPVSDTLYA